VYQYKDPELGDGNGAQNTELVGLGKKPKKEQPPAE